MRYLVTGHTGFKGAWLSLMLHQQGHEVVGLSLDPEAGGLFQRAAVDQVLAADIRLDIRDANGLRSAVRDADPEVLIHLAAQPLVRQSYRDPRTTHETNVLGTYNVLEASESARGLRAQLVITTDKVYRNVDQIWGYRENDALGGIDPYSASKAAADLLAQSWIATHQDAAPTAIARAGNVVGGGDVCAERLLVDVIAAFSRNEPVTLRYPGAVRPWQHVLDCLNGYLMIVSALLAGTARGEAFNIGPGTDSFVSVSEVTDRVARLWGAGASWIADGGGHAHEAGLLALDARKAEVQLGWCNRLSFDETMAWTVDWARRTADGEDPRHVTLEQIHRFAQLPGRSGRASAGEPAVVRPTKNAGAH